LLKNSELQKAKSYKGKAPSGAFFFSSNNPTLNLEPETFEF